MFVACEYRSIMSPVGGLALVAKNREMFNSFTFQHFHKSKISKFTGSKTCHCLCPQNDFYFDAVAAEKFDPGEEEGIVLGPQFYDLSGQLFAPQD